MGTEDYGHCRVDREIDKCMMDFGKLYDNKMFGNFFLTMRSWESCQKFTKSYDQ